RFSGDTRTLHGPRPNDDARQPGGVKKVELVVNGKVVAGKEVPADGKPHELRFKVKVEKSSWLALRHFPQMHTNPVNVIVAGRPIRASRESALWCAECVEQLWRSRARAISPAERDEARQTFDRAIEVYRKIAEEAR